MRRTFRSAPRTVAFILLGALALPAAVRGQQGARGTFTIRSTDVFDRVAIELVPDARDVDRAPMTIEAGLGEVRGPLRDQLLAAGDAPVQFMVAREAGTFVFQGPIGRGVGRGSYVFVADDFYAKALARRLYARPRVVEQARLAASDVRVALVDELGALGYARPTVRELIRLGAHGVTLDFAQGLADAGVRLRRPGDLLSFREHGISAEWIADMRRAGYGDVPPGELIRMKDRGVDPQFVAQLAAAGYNALTPDEAILAREHGLDTSFIQAFRREGFLDLTIPDLVQLRDHGISAGFARRMRERSGSTPSADELVSATRPHSGG